MPDGRLPRPAIERMREMGDWLGANGEAIYETRPLAPYRQGPWAFVRTKADRRFAIRLWEEGCLDKNVVIGLNSVVKGVKKVRHIATGRMLEARTFENALNDEAGIVVAIPDDFKFNRYADAFELLPDEATGWRE